MSIAKKSNIFFNNDGIGRFLLSRIEPKFIIIGAQKSGTTSLFHYLKQCPAIQSPTKKEIGFFSKDKNFAKGKDWYLTHFPSILFFKRKYFTSFEATPEYLYYPFCAERIMRYNPEMKFIVVLRDPIKRAFSAWNMYREFHKDRNAYLNILSDGNYFNSLKEIFENNEFISFHEAVEQELKDINGGASNGEPSFVKRGLYSLQLENYFNFFPIKNFLIIDDKELKENPSVVMRNISDFLCVKDDWTNNLNHHLKHVREYENYPESNTIALLKDFYKPYDELLKKLLNREFYWMN